MCGILGVHNIRKIDRGLVSKQLQSIEHRGPDGDGLWINETDTLALGSRRLAIQDLSENGQMPFFSIDGRYVIVFNGEIYNHPSLKADLIKKGFIFKSNSDTESVLNSYIYWGEGCVNYLEGMFAFAIFDTEKELLFIARDRAGEKPLYYWKHEDGLSFSSEIKQLLSDSSLPKKLNLLALKQYLEDGYNKGDVSFVKNVFKLEAANLLIYDLRSKKITIEKYWSIPKYENNNSSKEDLVQELDSLLSKSVKNQLISDVPLGVLLSGGVDSSLITCYAVQHSHKRIKTFHISFDGFGKYNESEYARTIANYFDTEHIELSGNSISFDMIDELMNYYDEPLADSSMLPTFLVSKLTKQYVTVALGGDGGDELFGGYTTYTPILSHHENTGLIPNSVRKLAAVTASNLPVGMKGRNYIMKLEGNNYDRFNHNRLFDSHTIKKILNKSVWNDTKNLISKPLLDNSNDLLYDITKFDFENYLCEDILVKVDRASMGVSLEMRAPWLDKNVIEFAFKKVKSSFKIENGELKSLPKELLKKKLKIDFDLKRKQGFSIPLNSWIAEKWYNNFIEEINQFPEFLDKKFALNMCKNVKKGYSNSSMLYGLIILSKWARKYEISL